MSDTETITPDIPHPFSERDDWGFDDDPPGDHEQMPRPVVERKMMALSWSIRQKPNWQEKVKDEEIIAKWRKEALDQQEGLHQERKLTPRMVDYVLQELHSYSKLADTKTGIQHACDDPIFWSNGLISESLKAAVHEAITKLEDVPENEKDWHPGSNGQVLDLVHPSLYPIIYGRTLAKDTDNKTIVLQPPEEEYKDTFISRKHCWLPSDFAIAKNGSTKLISPYINNIHPSNMSLCATIEQLVEAFVPMWERVLGSVDRNNRPDRGLPDEREAWPMRIPNYRCLWGDGDRAEYLQVRMGNILKEDSEYADFPGDDREERRENWIRSSGNVIFPDAPEEYNDALERNFRVLDLKERTLQVIVKIANIHLTPESPEYPGGSWHVEGMLNERIVSTGIYYHDSENITESHLAFRVAVKGPDAHCQDDDRCTRWIYNFGRDDELVEERGSVPTQEGTCLAFPNIYQHCVSPFSLIDRGKPGHRKIVALFLVDPYQPIPSATTILPQQKDWFWEEIHSAEHQADKMSMLGKLPNELKDLIVDKTEGLMTREEAENYRKDLMKERSVFVGNYNEEVMGITFNMCEH